MAVVNVSLFIISILLSSARAIHNPTCNETQCKLLPIGEDVVLKFQELAAEEGVRIIYLNTELWNDSYHPLESNERFFAERWVWGNTISEPMLSLLESKDDYIVYSFGLLKYQVRYLKVPLQDQPRGCLARLSTSCQNNVVGQTLLANFTKVSSDMRLQKAVPADCVCALHIVDSKLKQVCCSVENVTELNYPRVHCEFRAQSTWLQILDGFKGLFMFILSLYSTALPLLLPDWIINLQQEYEKDKSMQTQARNNQVIPGQQNACELDQRGDSDNIHGHGEDFYSVGDRILHRDIVNDSNDEHQMSGNQSPDPHRGIEMRHDTDETGNERNLIFVQPTNQFDNNVNEDTRDQHQARSYQGSNDSVEREVSEQGTSEEDFSYGGERNVQRDNDDENNDEQKRTSNQVSSDHEHETNQSADLDDETSEDDVGIVRNPYGELLTEVREDQEALDRKIPLDDTSPITFGALLSDYAKDLPDFHINFNLKMLFLCFVVFPCFLYLKAALIIFQRMEPYREFYQTLKNCSKEHTKDFIFCSAIAWFSSQKLLNTAYLVSWVFLFIILLSIRPKDLFYSNDDFLFCFHDNCPSVSLGHEIMIHLNLQRHWAYDLTFFTLSKYMSALKTCLVRRVLCKITLQRRTRTFRSLCYLFSSLIGLLLSAVLGTICIVVFLVSLGFLILISSPLSTSYMFLLKKFMRIMVYFIFFSKVCSFILVFVMSTFFFILLFRFTSLILVTSAGFIIRVFLFTVMGLVLNAELITPYVAFTLVVIRNLYLCYSNLQSRYKEVKDMIAKHWKENIEQPPNQDSDNEETIPKDLFWFVCGKGKSDHQKNVLPLRAEICSMLRDMVLILTFLSVSLFAILVFKSMTDISALVSTIFVFVSGVIPSLIFQGFTNKEKFSGWNKIKIERKIKEAVKEYISRQTESTLPDSNSFQWFFRYGTDSESD